jgi:hypothetical protein
MSSFVVPTRFGLGVWWANDERKSSPFPTTQAESDSRVDSKLGELAADREFKGTNAYPIAGDSSLLRLLPHT